MLEAANLRRRRRGQEELTEDSVRASLGQDLAEAVKQRDDYMADLEVPQVLEVKNARRRAKGLPDLTVEEFRASLELDG
jgi:hypothetical protein